MRNHKPTIGSLTKEIMGLVWILIKIIVSYIEDFTREILNLAISHDTNNHLSEEDESRERACLLYTSPSPRDRTRSRMPSSA